MKINFHIKEQTIVWLAVISFGVTLGTSEPIYADLVHLKTGGKLRGKISNSKSSNSDSMTIELPTGAVIVVAQKEVKAVQKRAANLEAYDAKLRLADDNVESQWKLAEWCKKKGLPRQRKIHLEKVIQHDPENLVAHRALGHVQRDGKWTTRDEVMKAQGYVKHKNKFVTPEEMELIAEAEADKKAEKVWYSKIRLWRRWLKSSNDKKQSEAKDNLQAIRDGSAITPLVRSFSDDKNPNARMFYVSILDQIPSERALPPLVKQSLFDADKKVRTFTLNLIVKNHASAALPLYIRDLKHKGNTIVRRSAHALGKLGLPEAVPSLIDALVTVHRYRVRVKQPETGVSLGSDGSTSYAGGGSGLPPEIEAQARLGLLPHGIAYKRNQQNGATRLVTVSVDHKNTEALLALKTLTEKDYGFNKRSWQRWWVAKQNAN